MKKLFGLRAN